MASWALRERELRRELTAERSRTPEPNEPPSESAGLGEGELRDAFEAAQEARPRRRPRWADDLLGEPPDAED